FYNRLKKFAAVIRNNPMIPIDTSPLQFLICNISSSSLLPLYLFLHIEKYIIHVIINRTLTIIKTILMLSLLLLYSFYILCYLFIIFVFFYILKYLLTLLELSNYMSSYTNIYST